MLGLTIKNMTLKTFSKANSSSNALIAVAFILLISLWMFIGIRSTEDKVLVLKQSIANLQNIAISFKEHSQATIRNSRHP